MTVHQSNYVQKLKSSRFVNIISVDETVSKTIIIIHTDSLTSPECIRKRVIGLRAAKNNLIIPPLLTNFTR